MSHDTPTLRQSYTETMPTDSPRRVTYGDPETALRVEVMHTDREAHSRDALLAAATLAEMDRLGVEAPEAPTSQSKLTH